MKRKWNDEQLIEAVKTSNRLGDVARKLGLTVLGRNYKTLKKHIARLNLNTCHFMNKQEMIREARKNISKLSIDQIFSINSVDRKYIKKLVLKMQLLEYKCDTCDIIKWMDKELTLHLDHKNGINNDNRIENLRFLCPNCHSQTSTYCGRNIK